MPNCTSIKSSRQYTPHDVATTVALADPHGRQILPSGSVTPPVDRAPSSQEMSVDFGENKQLFGPKPDRTMPTRRESRNNLYPSERHTWFASQLDEIELQF
jgi:hypothetical protein